LFGRRGGGAAAVLGGDVALQRYRDLRAGMENPANINRYNTFNENMMGTTRGVARSTLQEFNVAMIELGDKALPMATAGLKGFSTALGWFGGGHQTKEDKTFTPSWAERFHELMPWSGASALPKPQPQSFEGGSPFGDWKGPGSKDWKAPNLNFMQGPTAPPKAVLAPISLSLNVDGTTLARVMSEISANTFTTQAPAADGMGQFYGGDHNFPDK
jgi:hypothetical protein